jgi:bacterioferritin-associated ferredoxin
MIICRCNVLTESQALQSKLLGNNTPLAILNHNGMELCCGSCVSKLNRICEAPIVAAKVDFYDPTIDSAIVIEPTKCNSI